MGEYEAVLYAPDGDYVRDYRADSVEGVRQQLEDTGSKWIFYPFAVVSDGERIVEAADEPYFYEGTPLDLRFLVGMSLPGAGEKIDEVVREVNEWNESHCEKCGQALPEGDDE